ncbi:MAG: recombinase family protein [Dehalococcoidales bacterium]
MKVALYTRVSSEKQDVDLSISAQLRALREYSTRNGHQIIREFVDEAETGRTTARPAFKEMVSLARRPTKPFEQILVWKYSRFTRSREDSILYKAMLKKAGVQVVSINEPFDDTPTGRLLEAIIESLDEFYSDNLGEEVTRGMRESASRGFYLSSKAPYGYRKIRVRDGNKERTKLEIDPVEASIVADIFDGIINGKGLIETVRDLNEKGILAPKGKGWGKTGVYFILNNEIYTGVFVWGKNSKHGHEPIRTENICPSIIDRETFLKVQTLMKERMPKRIHPRRASSPFLLSGITYCGYCGKALVGKYAKNGEFAYYVCGTLDKKGSGSCLAKYLNTDKFESVVIKQIKERILTRGSLINLVHMVNDEMDSTMQSYQNELGLISDTITDINHRLERLYDAIEAGKLNLDDLIVRIRDLRQRQEQLQAKRIEIESQMSDRKVELTDLETVSCYIDELHDILKEGTLAERRTFIKSFIKDIRVTGNEAVLTYTMPMIPEKVTIEKEGVLPIVQYGGR